jgi:hypothetical protein
MPIQKCGDPGLRTATDLATQIGNLERPLKFEIRPQNEQVVGVHPSLLWRRTAGQGPASQRIQLPLGWRTVLPRSNGDIDAPPTTKAYRDKINAAAALSPPPQLSDEPTAGELQCLSVYLGMLLDYLTGAAIDFDRGQPKWQQGENEETTAARREAIASARQQAPALRTISNRLAELGTAVDALPDLTRDIHADIMRQCGDKLDRCQAAVYTLVNQVVGGSYSAFTDPYCKEVFPTPEARYYAARATGEDEGQFRLWGTSAQRAWAGRACDIPRLRDYVVAGILSVRDGKVPSSMKHDVRLDYALHRAPYRYGFRSEVMDGVLKRLRDESDPHRLAKVVDALNTVIDHRILTYHRDEHNRLANWRKDLVESMKHVDKNALKLFSKEFFDVIDAKQRDDIFARLQGPYAPVAGSAFHTALTQVGWKPMPMRDAA